jgi:uncharacterized protein (DUF302 family)
MRRVLASLLITLAATACNAGQDQPAAKAQTAPTAQAKTAGDTSDYMYMRTTTEMSFDDVATFLQVAIQDRGYKIDDHAFIGRMLSRTGEQMGITDNVFVNAQQYRFCPSSYSRRMLTADPRNLVFCPYVINFYNLKADPKTVYVTFRRPLIVGSDESKAALQSVDKLLKEIVDEALQ